MSRISFTPQELATPDYSNIDPARKGEGIEGRGKKGEGKGAGSDIFKANYIKQIYERGYGGGDIKTDWDDGDIGVFGKLHGVKVQDIRNYGFSQTKPILERKYNDRLKALNIKNNDGTQRQVQFGDTEAELDVLMAKGVEKQQLQKTEPKRVRKEKAAVDAQVKAENRDIRNQNATTKLQVELQNQNQGNIEETRRIQRDNRREDNKRQDALLEKQDKRYYADRQEARADKALQRSEGAADRAAMMKLKMYEVDAANAARADEFEYRREKDRLLKHQQLVASFTNLAAAFAV